MLQKRLNLKLKRVERIVLRFLARKVGEMMNIDVVKLSQNGDR